MAALQRPDSGDKEAVREYTNVLYKQEKWEQLFEYLQEALGSGNDPDLTWRLIRCGYRLGQKTFDAGDSGEAERIANICMERGQRALKENDRNANLHKVGRLTKFSLCLVNSRVSFPVGRNPSTAARGHWWNENQDSKCL